MISMRDQMTTIREWFVKNEVCGLVLPDGWYGRPFDNQHRLKTINGDGNTVKITLDNPDVSLVFAKLTSVEIVEKDLEFAGYVEATISSEVFQAVYREGVVALKTYRDESLTL